MRNLNQNYVKSRFSHTFKRGKKSQLLHSVIMRPLVLDQESLNLFNKFEKGENPKQLISKIPKSEGLINHLISEQMIHPKGYDETKKLKNWVEETANPKGLLIAYILPTDECNFGCKYCFIENNMNNSPRFKFMTEDTAKKGVDFFAKNLESKLSITPKIIFYGGEPLLNAPVVIKTINYVKSNYPSIEMDMVTNGSKITKEIAEIIHKNDVGISVSLDGPKKVHNSMRKFLDGRGTYNKAVKGYNLLKEAGCENVGISFTLGKHNLPNLQENIEKICEDLNPKSFGFNFMLDCFEGKNEFSMPMKYTTKQTIEAFKFLREKGIYEDRIMRKLKPFVKGFLHVKDCGAPGNQIVIAPNGDIGPCQGFLPSKKYFTMNVHNSPKLQEDPSFGEWKNRYPTNIEGCLDCEALGVCGGGCAYNAYMTHGDIWEMDERMCEHNKLFLKWAMWDFYDSKKKK